MLLFGCIKKIRRGATFGNFEKLNQQIINSKQLQKNGAYHATMTTNIGMARYSLHKLVPIFKPNYALL